MGCSIDWRRRCGSACARLVRLALCNSLAATLGRSFITTDLNPYYDSFIQWQFWTLYKHVRAGSRVAPLPQALAPPPLLD